MSVLVETSFGDFTIDLNTQKCPNATYNFIKLCKMKHYNNSLFKTIQKDYITQVRTENPTTIWKQLKTREQNHFKDQLDMEAKVNAYGLLITSNSGPNLNNSQFFITLTKAHLSSLNGKHSIFGKIQEGFDTLKKINETYVDEKGRPQMNIRILHTHVLHDPFDDPQNLVEPQSPELHRDSDRLEAIQHLQMLQKYTSQKDIIEATRKQKAKKQAITLEMLGDIPDADMKPPENIIFICKLNPITQQRDLQIIFSRFGPIKSVQIVRDWKTGQSLQYGFIEFESEKSCEEAYLKMENVLIDDRRIHVDFSQSVSKMMPRTKVKQIKPAFKSGENKDRGRQLVAKISDQRMYHGTTKYDIIAKDNNKNNQSQKPNRKYNQNPRGQRDKITSEPSSSDEQSQEKQKSISRQKKQRKQKKSRKQKDRKTQKSKYRYRSRQKSYSSDKKYRSSKKQKKNKDKRKIRNQ